MSEQRKSKDIFRTVNGINGININKVLEFLTGERAHSYKWDNDSKEFVYIIKKDFANDEQVKEMTRKELIDKFQEFFQVKVKLVDFDA